MYVFITFLILIASLVLLFKPRRRSTIPIAAKNSTEVLDGIKKCGNLVDYFKECHKKFGDIFQLELSGANHVILCNIKDLKGLEVLGDRCLELIEPLTPLIGATSLEFVGQLEAERRRSQYRWWLSHNLATKSRNMTELISSFEGLVSEFIAQQEEYFNIIPVMKYPIIKYSLESLYGSFESPEVLSDFIESYDKAYIRWEDFSTGKIMGNIKDDKNVAAAMRELRTVLDRIISNRRTCGSDEKRFIDVIMETLPTDEEIKDEALAFFTGSFHNAINSFYFILYYLAKHQDIQERVYREIHEHLGTEPSPDYTNFDKLTYLKQMIREVQRVSNSGILVLRLMAKDTEISGHLVEKGTRVIIPLNVINGDTRLFNNPEKFNPDKFSDENRPKIPNLNNISFGFGKRVCPGIHIAKVELLVGTAVIIRSLKLELRPDHPPVGHLYTTAASPDSDIFIKASPRY